MKDVLRNSSAPINAYTNTGVLEYNKIYEAYVIDRNDPEGSGRIKVYIPELMSYDEFMKDYGIWIRIQRRFQGEFIIPQINQWIRLMFLYGDPQLAIMLGVIPSAEETHPYFM